MKIFVDLKDLPSHKLWGHRKLLEEGAGVTAELHTADLVGY
jgi:hypothetical protein